MSVNIAKWCHWNEATKHGKELLGISNPCHTMENKKQKDDYCIQCRIHHSRKDDGQYLVARYKLNLNITVVC
jgi:hypothetical protein